MERVTNRRIFYGWYIVAALSLTETVSWGILYYAFSVILTPMRDELGWTTATLTGAYSLALLVSGLAAPFVGRWIDRNGSRLIMTTGSLLGVAVVLAWSRVESIVALYVIWAFVGLAMSATLYEPAFSTVTIWFERKRSTAVLIITIFAGFASTIFLPLTAWLVDLNGWRDALVTLAAILAILTIMPHLLVLRSRPEAMGLLPDGGNRSSHAQTTRPIANLTLRDALRDRAFWWLAIAFSLETFSMIAVAVHLIPYLTERGDGARFAATVTGLIGAAQVLARVVATLFGNRVSEVQMTALVFGLQAIAIAVLLQWQSTAGVLVAVLLLGAGRGVVTLMRAALVARFYGRTHFGVINGTLALFLTGSRALAPVGAGLTYVAFGGYVPVLWAMAAFSALAALAMLRIGDRRAVAA